jgi:hypothetical protein
MNILHVLVTHVAAELVDTQAALLSNQFPGMVRLIAYGGSPAAFEAIRHPHKIYLQDESLRGSTAHQCFNELIPKLTAFITQGGHSFDFIHVSEYDHLILSGNYFTELESAWTRSGADFLGKNCGIKTHSNWPHALHYRDDPTLRRYLASFSVREDPTVLCGSLGNGYTISKRALQSCAQLPELPRVYFEVLFPTLVHHLGWRIADIGEYSRIFRHVRWQPEWTATEVTSLIREGVLCCHPFKDIKTAALLLQQ